MQYFPVLKANAYGHGMIPVAEAAGGWCCRICVAILDEPSFTAFNLRNPFWC